MKVSMNVWCMKNLVQIAFCGFLGAVSTPTKSLKRVFVSAPNWETSPLLRMFGTTAWWLESVHFSWWEKKKKQNKKNISREAKTFRLIPKAFNQGDGCHNPWQVSFRSNSKAYYGRKRTVTKMKPAFGAVANICAKMSVIPTARCHHIMRVIGHKFKQVFCRS